MTLTIHKPELEALIQERLNSGVFENVERCADAGAKIVAAGVAARSDQAPVSQ